MVHSSGALSFPRVSRLTRSRPSSNKPIVHRFGDFVSPRKKDRSFSATEWRELPRGTTHIGEALRLFPFMGWGRDHSIGHYIDLSSAALGATLFPLGYLLQTLARDESRQGSPIAGCAEPSVTKRQAREDKQVEDG